jgi:hypothetical protein
MPKNSGKTPKKCLKNTPKMAKKGQKQAFFI